MDESDAPPSKVGFFSDPRLLADAFDTAEYYAWDQDCDEGNVFSTVGEALQDYIHLQGLSNITQPVQIFAFVEAKPLSRARQKERVAQTITELLEEEDDAPSSFSFTAEQDIVSFVESSP